MTTQIDRRQSCVCMCGCNSVATHPHFRFIERDGVRFSVLPGHEPRARERMAAVNQLCDLVGSRHGFWRRQRESRTILRLHRIIGTGRWPRWRSAILYAMPVALRPILGPLLARN